MIQANSDQSVLKLPKLVENDQQRMGMVSEASAYLSDILARYARHESL